MKRKKPEIPPQTVANWQRIVDLIAGLANVPASLVMRTDKPDHSVFVSNHGRKHPYEVGLRFTLSEKLYCYGVLRDGELVVEDAACDPDWADNDDLEYGMRFYMGFPLHWPDGAVFGTICVLDTRRNKAALRFREGLREFSRVIEADLKLLTEIERRNRLEVELQATLDQLETRVSARTSELEEANTALRVLLSGIERSREEFGSQILSQIKGLVIPHVAKLRSRVEADVTASAYLDMVEDNLKSITSPLSGHMTAMLEGLTPAEQDVAQMIIRGQTTKDIARTLSREPSTIEYHRNNIRRKLGLRKSGQNLRSKLRSIR